MIDYAIPRKYSKQLSKQRLDHAFNVFVNTLELNAGCAVSLKVTDNTTIQKLNYQYRQIDAPTDVLSFENDYIDPESGLRYLGDIVISFEKTLTQAQEANSNFMDEFEMLLIHGLLHLVGYDHSDKLEHAEMEQLQDKILIEIGNPLTGSIADAE